MRGSVAVTIRLSAVCARGGGAIAASALRRSPTPKFFSALPKKIGVIVALGKSPGIEALAGMAHEIELMTDGLGVELRVQSGYFGDCHFAQPAGMHRHRRRASARHRL